jgi:hypothetical protein
VTDERVRISRVGLEEDGGEEEGEVMKVRVRVVRWAEKGPKTGKDELR